MARTVYRNEDVFAWRKEEFWRWRRKASDSCRASAGKEKQGTAEYFRLIK
jgi:hypothetical protein